MDEHGRLGTLLGHFDGNDPLLRQQIVRARKESILKPESMIAILASIVRRNKH